MVIKDIVMEETDNGQLLQASVSLLSDGKKATRFYVETDCRDLLCGDGNGWLLASFLPAMEAGEKELVIEGTICPLLAANAEVAASLMRQWFPDLKPFPKIVAQFDRKVPSGGTGVFVSGGLDSMYALHDLSKQSLPGRPGELRAGLFVNYQVDTLEAAESEARFEEGCRRARFLVEAKGLEFLSLRTNLRNLRPGGRFWTRRYHGAMLAAVAHFASRRLCDFHIASSVSIGNFEGKASSYAWGSHPMIDPLYSSHHMRLHHHGLELPKADKIAALADWPEGLGRMQVCTSKSSGGRNCGRCKKCLKTKMYLIMNGQNKMLELFNYPEISARDVATIQISSDWMCLVYEYVRDRLRQTQGETDTVLALQKIIRRYARMRPLRRLLGRIR